MKNKISFEDEFEGRTIRQKGLHIFLMLLTIIFSSIAIYQLTLKILEPIS